MASEEFKYSDMLHLPPILPRYNYDLLSSLDDIYLEEIRKDNQWSPPGEFSSISLNEEIKEEITIESEPELEYYKSESTFASSITNDTWNCPICLDIFEDPVETPCCHNLFCEKCIEPVLKCPICKRLLVRCLPNIPFRRLIQELSVRCRHHFCGKIVKKEFLSKHEAQCDKALIRCNYSPACGEIIRKDLQHHLNSCPYRPTNCPLECGLSLPYMDIDGHVSTACLNSLILCPQECESTLLRRDITVHCNQNCPNTLVACPLFDYFGTFCGFQCLRKDFKEHQLICNFREVKCENSGCNERVMYQYLQDHEDLCKYKEIKCTNGCNALFLRIELERHKSVCELEVIDCSYKVLGCTNSITRESFEEHLKEFVKEHEDMMLKTYSKHIDQIKKLENELQELRCNTMGDISEIRTLLKNRRNSLDYISS
jgi:TRAF-type zinc finger/Zinc finger, C3HC4 type (RING finger)